jgi:hypothetical protein
MVEKINFTQSQKSPTLNLELIVVAVIIVMMETVVQLMLKFLHPELCSINSPMTSRTDLIRGNPLLSKTYLKYFSMKKYIGVFWREDISKHATFPTNLAYVS